MDSLRLLAANLIFAAVLGLSNAEHNPFRHNLVLDHGGNVVLDWIVDLTQSVIYFNISVRTNGYVGFGLANNGKFKGADIVIGGVYSNGISYFSDRHGISTGETVTDVSQDWRLLAAWESYSHTTLSFSRPFETCDLENDQPINDNSAQLIWYYGLTDDIRSPPVDRGNTPVYLLDPDLTPREVTSMNYINVTQPQFTQPLLGDMNTWRIQFDREIPADKTTYLCTIHKPPTRTKHHMIGFRTILNGELERKHVHHFLLFKCRAPSGVSADSLFGPHLGRPGVGCYHRAGPQNAIPSQYCLQPISVWAIGGGSMFIPDHVGIPMTESPDEYFLMQVHHDNPDEVENLRLQYALEIFYTEHLRKYDGGGLFLGSPIPYPGATTIVIPPNSKDHAIYGHCAAGCTEKMFPPSGIQIFAALPHAHFASTSIRTTRIHNGVESAIVVDDQYNPYYQPRRVLRRETTVLPGDTLVVRCLFDTTNRTETTTGGYSAGQEMCSVFAFYYPLLRDYAGCTGELEADSYRKTLNIFETEWSDDEIDEIVTSPISSSGLTVTEAASRVNWDSNARKNLQTLQQFLPQVSKCPNTSPDSIRRALQLQQTPSSNEILGQLFKEVFLEAGPEVYSDFHEDILAGDEFISHWPNNFSPYRPSSRCPTYKFQSLKK